MLPQRLQRAPQIISNMQKQVISINYSSRDGAWLRQEPDMLMDAAAPRLRAVAFKRFRSSGAPGRSSSGCEGAEMRLLL